MKKFTLIALSFFCFLLVEAKTRQQRQGNLIFENIPEMSRALEKKLIPYSHVRGAGFRDWLPANQGILISTRFADVSQIHKVETPKGARQQLTFFDEPVGGGYVCPDPDYPYFLFTKDSAGNELTQIYKCNYKTGLYQCLTDGRSRHRFVRWSNRGDKFAFTSTMRNERDFDIYLGTLAGVQSFQCILETEGFWSTLDFSPDDTQLLIEHYVSSTESHFYILNIRTKQLTTINPSEQNISYGSARWSPDGKGVYLTSDQFSDFKQLQYYDLATGHIDILSTQIPWDVADFEIAPDGDVIALVSNEGGFIKLYFLDVPTRKITQARLPDGQIYGIHFKPTGNQLAFVMNRPTAPSDVYTLDLDTKTFLRWTYSEVIGLDTADFVAPVLIHYPTFDSVNGAPRMIPAFYYIPTRSEPPYPVIIMCHGGPTSQYIPYFSTTIQFNLNELGIAYIAPNVRGSSGYGKTYKTLDDGYKREDAVRDIGALLDWIEKQPELDASRVAIRGGSYGGYMVLASMAHYSNRLRCGIDSYGISSFVTFLRTTADYRRQLRREEYGDERDPEMRQFLNSISPLTNAHKITRPLFIVQGLNDPRVPVSEAEQIRDAVRDNGIDVWYLLAEDEGHGLSKKENFEFYRRARIMFWKEYLLE